jgi:hypothetical protein
MKQNKLIVSAIILIIFAIALVIGLGGCAPRYQVIETGQEELLADQAKVFFGLKDYLGDQPLHVIMVHGMGYCPPIDQQEAKCDLYGTPFKDVTNTILKALGNAPIELEPELILHEQVRQFSSAIKLESGHEIIFHGINYAGYLAFEDGIPYSSEDGLGEATDKQLLWDNDQPLVAHSPSINRNLKNRLVSWGLADAATLMNPLKRSYIITGVTTALKNIYESYKDSGQTPRVVFITWSLGSKVLFDSLVEFYGLSTGDADDTIDLLDNTQTIYMMANQLPLLELATEGTELDLKFNLEKLPLPDKLYFVAFSDPGDLLTYRIHPTINSYLGSEQALYAIDIATNNAGSFFWLFKDPAKAHSGHMANDAVVELLVEGLKRSK